MLIKFAVTNYRGFRNRIEWDLTKTSNYEFNTYSVREGVIKNGIIYGQNGCGKSNFALALFDIVNHLSLKWKLPNYYQNFIYAGDINNSNGVVRFEYTFKIDNTIIEYQYSKNKNGVIVQEQLSCSGDMIFDRKDKDIYINSKYFEINSTLQKELLDSANNISVITFIRSKVTLRKEHFLNRLQDFVDTMLWFKSLDERQFIGLDYNVTDIEQYIILNDLVQDFEEFVNRISNQNFRFATAKREDTNLDCLIGEQRIHFLSIASTGTKSLELLYYWVKQLNKASFVFIDEFDAFYHYKLSFNICKELFQLGCQVFVSSHNTYLMSNDLLRPDCNFIIDNNKIKALNECTEKELRFGHNIEKLFRGNTFVV
jgi:AAA15 family ATPase/GTPase